MTARRTALAAALLCLLLAACRSNPPMRVVEAIDGPSALTAKAVEVYSRKSTRDQVPPRLAVISKESTASTTVCPLLMGTPELFATAELQEALRDAVRRGTTLAVEIPSDATPAEAERTVLGLVEGGRVADLPADTPLLKDYPGKTKPSLKAVLRAEGDVAAIFLAPFEELTLIIVILLLELVYVDMIAKDTSNHNLAGHIVPLLKVYRADKGFKRISLHRITQTRVVVFAQNDIKAHIIGDLIKCPTLHDLRSHFGQESLRAIRILFE